MPYELEHLFHGYLRSVYVFGEVSSDLLPILTGCFKSSLYILDKSPWPDMFSKYCLSVRGLFFFLLIVVIVSLVLYLKSHSHTQGCIDFILC